MKFSIPDLMQNVSRLANDERLSGAKAAFQRFLADVKPVIESKLPDAAGLGETIARAFHPKNEQTPDDKTEQFLARNFTNSAEARPYKLYIPNSYHGQPVPLVVMLHGCTQSPDDFAIGTKMNTAANGGPFLVVYPGQISSANIQKCWNWFNAAEQQRNGPEASLIAGITREVMRDYAVDPRRVFVAGLSAGGAAAAIMGQAYPDLYAAICVHSGLACGAAREMTSAFAAMQKGAEGIRRADQKTVVPAIVFHGTKDTTVNPRNGDSVVAQSANGKPLRIRVESGQIPGGYAFRRTLHLDTTGDTVVEQWVVEGAGHAWFGGNPAGSFTDPRGPDATREMMRFFLDHPSPVNAA